IGDHQSVAHVERVERPEVAESSIPGAGFKIGSKLRHSASNDIAVEERKTRNPGAHSGIQVRLRSTPEGGQESVDAVVGNSDAINSTIPEVMHDFSNRRTPTAIELDDLWEVRLGEPEVSNVARLERQDHQAIRHSFHFSETGTPIGPVMQCEHGQGGIKGVGS